MRYRARMALRDAGRAITTAISCAIAVLMVAARHARIGRVVVTSGVMLGMLGCSPAAVHPPETDYHRRDADKETCVYGRAADAAIAACERVLARPEPIEWPGAGDHRIRNAIVYGARGEAALALARRLVTVGRAQDAAAACRKARAYLERSTALWVDDSGQGSPAETTQLVERATTCPR